LQPQYRGRFDADLRSIRVGRWRLLEDERGRIELYDVEADPRELAEVSAANSGVVESLRGLLARWVAAHPPGETVKLERGPSSRGREEALRRTGYAGDEEAPRPR
jgi:hypothetical protein